MNPVEEFKKCCYMLLEVLGKKVSEPRLGAVREHVIQPVTIVDDVLGTFELDRQFSLFEGTIDWLGAKCNVSLQTDEEAGETAERAYIHLKKLYGNLKEWDEKFRLFAADELWELANDWYQGEDADVDSEGVDESEDNIHITREEFFSRISIGSIVINSRGSLTLYYEADEMFTDHAIEIDANINGEMKRADIVG